MKVEGFGVEETVTSSIAQPTLAVVWARYNGTTCSAGMPPVFVTATPTQYAGATPPFLQPPFPATTTLKLL
jgi:hypothetical protein